MTFPTIPTTGNGRMAGPIFQANTTATRTFPSLTGLTKNAGDLLIAVIVAYQRSAANATFSGWTGSFTELADVDGGTSTTMAVGIATKISTGSETGTISVTQAATVTGHVGMFLFSIAGWHGTSLPELTALAVDTAAAADPGALSPSWGAADTLWISVAGNGETGTGGAWTGFLGTIPTNYSDDVYTSPSGDVVGAIEGAVSFRQLNAASEDVGTWGVDTSNARNCALLLAVRPEIPADQNITPAVLDASATFFNPTVLNRFEGSVTETETGNRAASRLCLLGLEGTYASTPDNAALDITGDIDIAVDLVLPDWTPGAFKALVAKNSITNQRSYQLGISSVGRPEIRWYIDGQTTTLTAQSTVATGTTDGTRRAIRVTLDVDDGAGNRVAKFYTAACIEGPWTQLGTTVTTAGTTSIFAGTSPLEIGTNEGGTGSITTGGIYSAWVRNGIDGTLVAYPRFIDTPDGTASFADAPGRTWSINGAARINGLISGTTTPLTGVVASVQGNDTLAASGTVSADLTVTPDSLDASATLLNPTLSINVTPDVLSASVTLFDPTVAAAQAGALEIGAVEWLLSVEESVEGTVQPSVLNVQVTFFDPIVVPGAVTLTPNTLDASVTIHQPVVAEEGAQQIAPNTLDASVVFQQPTITTSVTVTTDVLSASVTLFDPIVTPGSVTLTPNVLNASVTVHDPVVAEEGAQSVSLDVINASVTIFNPIITTGSVNVTPNALDASVTLFDPVVIPGAITLTPNTLDASVTFNDPSVSIFITPATLDASVTLPTPTLDISNIVTPNTLDTSGTFGTPTITVGAVNITPDVLDVSVTIHEPVVAEEGAQAITPATLNASVTFLTPVIQSGSITVVIDSVINASATLLDPTVQAISAVEPATLAAPATFFDPTITTGQVVIEMLVINASATIPTPSVIGLFADPYPVEIGFTDSNYTLEVTTPDYSVASVEASGVLDYTSVSGAVDYSDGADISVVAGSYVVEHTEGG